jgi:hypothetical protein
MVTFIDLINPNKEKSPSLAKQRFNVCNSCDDLQKPLDMCKHCGCFMKAKTRLVEATCPLNKWEK